MNAQTKIEAHPLYALRAPFTGGQISKLPKETRKQIDERNSDRSKMVWKCGECGGAHHAKAVHLDYVGHAALTDRLLDVDPEWDWEPLALTPEGLPLFDVNGGLWIKLTVLGQSRLGYGNADGKKGGDAIKEIIGDALRNAAMRFGAALDLWHKGDLHGEDAGEPQPEQKPGATEKRTTDKGPASEGMPDAEWAKLTSLLKSTNTAAAVLIEHYQVRNLRMLSQEQYTDAVSRLEDTLAKMAREQTNDRNGRGDFSPADADACNF